MANLVGKFDSLSKKALKIGAEMMSEEIDPNEMFGKTFGLALEGISFEKDFFEKVEGIFQKVEAAEAAHKELNEKLETIQKTLNSIQSSAWALSAKKADK